MGDADTLPISTNRSPHKDLYISIIQGQHKELYDLQGPLASSMSLGSPQDLRRTCAYRSCWISSTQDLHKIVSQGQTFCVSPGDLRNAHGCITRAQFARKFTGKTAQERMEHPDQALASTPTVRTLHVNTGWEKKSIQWSKSLILSLVNVASSKIKGVAE